MKPPFDFERFVPPLSLKAPYRAGLNQHMTGMKKADMDQMKLRWYRRKLKQLRTGR
jgi:hypothetical protein